MYFTFANNIYSLNESYTICSWNIEYFIVFIEEEIKNSMPICLLDVIYVVNCPIVSML